VKGIVLAGGFGRRLEPLTRVTNKHLLPVYDRPMVYYAVEQLVGAGIEEIMIITGGNHAGEFLRLLGNGGAFGLKHLDYAYQEQAGGIAQALGLAEHFAAAGPVAVILGDNIFERSLAPIVDNFRKNPRGARIALATVDNPSAYGVAVMENGKLVRIVEKPADPPSHFAVTGFYLYDARVFDFVKQLRPSQRSELEITDVNNQYLQLGELSHDAIDGYWADCGESIDMLLRASNLVAKHGANRRS
jgi:glucose-1-phosphate thymidylyltransferase